MTGAGRRGLPRWGDPGTRVLPAAVRDFAPDPADHGALLAALGADSLAGAAAVFDAPLAEPVDTAAFHRVLRALLGRGLGLQAALGSARPALEQAGADAFADAVPWLAWRERTGNAVLHACGNDTRSVHGLLLGASVDDLLALPSFGALSLFDLLGTVEAAVMPDLPYEAPAPRGAGPLRAWGEPGSRILPAVVRDHAAAVPGSAEVLLATLRLPARTNPESRFEAPVAEPFDPAAVRGALQALFDRGMADRPAVGSAAAALAAVTSDELAGAVPAMRLRTRTRNIVAREFGDAGLRDWLLSATARDVMAVRNLGVVSFFDLLVGVEAAAEAVTGAAAVARLEGTAGPRSVPQQPALPAKPPLPEWAAAIVGDDPRFRPLLGRAADLAALHQGALPGASRSLAETIAAAADRLAGLTGLTVEQESRTVLRAALGGRDERWLHAMALRYGLDGEPPRTLEQVGAAMGVTRERVRQVQSKTAPLLPSRPVHAPATDQALEMLEWTLPCRHEEFAEALSAAGLSVNARWTAEAFRATIALTGRRVDLDEQDGLIGRPEQLRLAGQIQAAAKAVSNSHGTADAGSVGRRLARETGETSPEGDVLAVMRAMPGLTWADRDTAWAEHPPGRNRLVNTSLRILAVISPQTLDDLHGGIEREYSFRVSSNIRYADLVAPAAERLAAFYESHPAFRRTPDGRVEAVKPMPFDVLGEEKQALVTVLRGQPHQAMDRLSLLTACDDIGMSSSTVNVWTTYAECLKRFGPNVWGLRGAVVPAEAIAEIQAVAKDVRRTTDRTKVAGTTLSGRPWVARRVTPSFVYSGVMPFDWGRSGLEDRSLSAVDMTNGEPAGTIRFAKSFNWGYSVFLRRQRATAGTVLRVLAAPDDGICYLELGGDELLGEPFDV